MVIGVVKLFSKTYSFADNHFISYIHVSERKITKRKTLITLKCVCIGSFFCFISPLIMDLVVIWIFLAIFFNLHISRWWCHLCQQYTRVFSLQQSDIELGAYWGKWDILLNIISPLLIPLSRMKNFWYSNFALV